MVDDSINMENDVERHYKSMQGGFFETFLKSASGDMSAPAPFNYGHKGATVCDMMQFALNIKGGVTQETIFAYLSKMSKEDDEAMKILETMAEQFIWITT